MSPRPKVTDQTATVRVRTTVENNHPRAKAEGGTHDPPLGIEIQTVLLEPTRPVTLADWRGQPVCKSGALEPLDVASWNYGRSYARGRERYPDKPIIYSESASALSTRGFYKLPHPKEKTDYDNPERYVDSYDLNSASGPRDIPDWDFWRMETDRYVAGEFVWTELTTALSTAIDCVGRT